MIRSIEIKLYADTDWCAVIDTEINQFNEEDNATLVSTFPVVRHGFVESVIATFSILQTAKNEE